MNIAHRGGAQLMPENTLAAFADALARGCDGVELDVQLSRDGAVVVHHDFRLMKDVARENGAWLTEPGPRIKDLMLAGVATVRCRAAAAGQRLCAEPSAAQADAGAGADTGRSGGAG